MHVTFWIRSEIVESEWVELLKPRRLKAARNLQEAKRAAGHDTHLVDCLYLGDKKTIIRASPTVLARLGLEEDDLSLLDQAETLRNRLAHAYENLAGEGTWADISKVVTWAEQLVQQSDELIEREATERAGHYEDELWASA